MSRNVKLALGLGALAAAAAAFAIVSGAEPPAAEAQGVDWQALTVAEALERARAEDKRVFVKFDAEWCSYCRRLDEEVLSTADGAALTENVIAVSVDFDAEANRPVVEQYVVLGLPTSLVLAADGTQVARIQGYNDRDEWVAELRSGLSATDPVPALRAAHERAPDDPEATLRLGEALLVRGHAAEGHALLERATWIAGETPEVGAEALFILGRFHHRVHRDPGQARHIWRELATRYPESDWAGGAWWWYAKAQAELGQPALGLEVLRRRAEASPGEVGRVSQWAEYVLEHGLDDERADADAALSPLAEAATGDEREELRTLSRRLRGEEPTD
jgi:thiol-disulfide isomerase/thioredoxin